MKEESYTAEVKNLIALCHILDEFEKFTKDLSHVLVGKYDYDYGENLRKLYKIANGDSIIVAKKIKEFYQDNAKIIDKIKEESYLWNFIVWLYNSNGTDISDEAHFFYQYIASYKKNIEQILSVLNKIKKLGFEKLTFNESFDFTITIYNIETCFYNAEITYLDNIEVIPSYENNFVKYTTNASNYKITAKFHSSSLFSDYINKQIEVNSLLFDAERLPNAITKENIFDRIIHLKNAQAETETAIRNSVDLSISIHDLELQVNSTNNVIENLSESVENKKELRDILKNMRKQLNQMSSISSIYDESISQSNPLITQEKLEEEKEWELTRRHEVL